MDEGRAGGRVADGAQMSAGPHRRLREQERKRRPRPSSAPVTLEALGGPAPSEPGSRWRTAAAAFVVFALWAVALVGMEGVFEPGEWFTRTLVAAAAMVAASTLVRILRTTARLSACLVGLAAAAALLVQQASAGGRAQWWLSDPRAVLVGIRLQLNEGVAPMRVSDPLVDLVVLVFLLGVWVSVLLLVGLDLHVVAGVVPALVLLVPVAVTGQRAPSELLAAAAVGLCALLWVDAPRALDWRAPVAAGTVLVVGAGVAMLAPATRDRIWNASAISVSPISPNVPDVTVALGEDLARPESAVAFRFSGVIPGTPMRFPLAVLTEFSGGTWHPSDTLDPASTSVSDLRLPEEVAFVEGTTAEEIARSAAPINVEIAGLVSTWLPLPQGTLLVRPSQGTEETSSWDPERWQWVEGTQTARSTRALTGRGDTYSAWAWQLMDSQDARFYYLGDADSGVEDRDSPIASDRADLGAYTQLPADVPDVIADTAREVTQGQTGRYAAAVALRDWFRSGSFTYDESAPYSPGADPDDPYATMEAFLEQRSGYCVHFATTFAVMARSLGMPTRVAVGYASSAGSGTTTDVDSRSLHAWPEVLMDGMGWIAFEPTPGGAGSRAESPLGVSVPDPVDEGSGTEGPSPSPSADQRDPLDSGGGSHSEEQSGGGGPSSGATWLPGVGLVALVLLVLLAATPVVLRCARRFARRRALMGGAAPALAAWAEFRDTVLDLDATDRDGSRVLRESGTDSGSGGGGGSSVVGDTPRARTPEALVEHLVAVGALEDGRGAELLARAVVAETFSGGPIGAGAPEAGSVPTPVPGSAARESLREALEGSVGDLRARAGMRARLRAAVLPRSALPTPVRASDPRHPVRGRGRRRIRSRRSSRE